MNFLYLGVGVAVVGLMGYVLGRYGEYRSPVLNLTDRNIDERLELSSKLMERALDFQKRNEEIKRAGLEALAAHDVEGFKRATEAAVALGKEIRDANEDVRKIGA